MSYKTLLETDFVLLVIIVLITVAVCSDLYSLDTGILGYIPT